MSEIQPTVQELRALRTVEDEQWIQAARDLADKGPFYTVDLYRLLVSRGMESWERRQNFFGRAHKILDRLEESGELVSDILPSPQCGLSRKYFCRPGDEAKLIEKSDFFSESLENQYEH